MNTDRKLKQEVYIRICKDSNFTMEFDQAARVAGLMLKCHPLEFWIAMDIKIMQQIAAGTHPVCKGNKNG